MVANGGFFEKHYAKALLSVLDQAHTGSFPGNMGLPILFGRKCSRIRRYIKPEHVQFGMYFSRRAISFQDIIQLRGVVGVFGGIGIGKSTSIREMAELLLRDGRMVLWMDLEVSNVSISQLFPGCTWVELVVELVVRTWAGTGAGAHCEEIMPSNILRSGLRTVLEAHGGSTVLIVDGLDVYCEEDRCSYAEFIEHARTNHNLVVLLAHPNTALRIVNRIEGVGTSTSFPFDHMFLLEGLDDSQVQEMVECLRNICSNAGFQLNSACCSLARLKNLAPGATTTKMVRGGGGEAFFEDSLSYQNPLLLQVLLQSSMAAVEERRQETNQLLECIVDLCFVMHTQKALGDRSFEFSPSITGEATLVDRCGRAVRRMLFELMHRIAMRSLFVGGDVTDDTWMLRRGRKCLSQEDIQTLICQLVTVSSSPSYGPKIDVDSSVMGSFLWEFVCSPSPIIRRVCPSSFAIRTEILLRFLGEWGCLNASVESQTAYCDVVCRALIACSADDTVRRLMGSLDRRWPLLRERCLTILSEHKEIEGLRRYLGSRSRKHEMWGALRDGIVCMCDGSIQCLLLEGSHYYYSWGAFPPNISGLFVDAQALGFLSCLRELNLSSNELYSLPSSLSLLTTLRKFAACYNRIEDLEPAAALSGLEELNVRRNVVSCISEQLCRATNLLRLDMACNHVMHLPQDISRLTRLHLLDLGSNLLGQCSQCLGRLCLLQGLRSLFLPNNGIVELEMPLLFSSLQELDLSYNRLPEVPASLCALTSLRWLNMSHNGLTSFPLGAALLTCLHRLDLCGNQLSYLPNGLFAGMLEMRHVDLGSNRLTDLPDLFPVPSNLLHLDMRNNLLTSLSPVHLSYLTSLETLHLSFNQLTSLPSATSLLTRLQRLYLSGNRLNSFPVELSILSSLRLLDVSDNDLLCGVSSLSHLTGLAVLDFSGNIWSP